MPNLKRMLRLLKSFFPRKLPIGMTSFNKWIDDIIFVSGLPDNKSTRQLAANFILHAPPTVTYMSIRKISGLLARAASYQVAAEIVKKEQPTAAPVLPVVSLVKNETEQPKNTSS